MSELNLFSCLFSQVKIEHKVKYLSELKLFSCLFSQVKIEHKVKYLSELKLSVFTSKNITQSIILERIKVSQSLVIQEATT